MKKNKDFIKILIIPLVIIITIIMTIGYLYQCRIKQESRMKFAKHCLNIIMNKQQSDYQKLIFPENKKILIQNKQYNLFLSQFYIIKSFQSAVNYSDWKINIKSINKYPPLDPLNPDVNKYASVKMPMPNFLMTFSKKKKNHTYKFSLYGKSYDGKNYIVFPVVEYN